MAGGQLVPHTLPNGQTIMVPGYLAPQPALAMPNVQVPQAPDMRVAGPGGGPQAQWGNEIPVLPEPTPAEKAAQFREKLLAQQGGASAPAAPSTNEHARKPQGREAELASMGGKKPAGGGVDPSTLVRPPARAEQSNDENDGEVSPLVRAAMRYSPGGGGSRRSGGMEVGTIREEQAPGKQLLPEQRWAMGLEARPAELYERDPDVPVSTIGTEEPAMREKLTPIEQGAKSFADRGVRQFEQEEAARHEEALARKQALVDQSELMDQQLGVIADRRTKIAKLQEISDQRAREADSIEPRTRAEIWEDKGSFAQVMGLVATVLGGLNQGRNGGPNPGLDMIDRFLDNAVNDERYKAERRGKMGLAAKNDYERALALYGDPEMAVLDTRNRKIANSLALTQNMIADRGLDATAKDRGLQLFSQLKAQLMEGVRQQQEMATGYVLSREVNYKQAPATGGGGGGNDPLKMLQRGAQATDYVNKIEGKGQGGPGRSIEGDKLNDVNAAMEALDAADAVERDVKALGFESSDIDDPLSGPLDRAASVLGTGGDSRRRRQSLGANTKRLARGIQQSLGKSDNDARLADEMAVGDGSGISRVRAAQTARKQALGRIQTATAGMTPQQREAFLEALPVERREQLRGAMREVASPRRGASEERGE
jgi:hypothetical protein